MSIPRRSHKISRKRVESLQQQIADDIREQIRLGKLRDRIPSEPDLEEMYEVSRVTVRGAVKILKKANVVTPVQGRGTYITGQP